MFVVLQSTGDTFVKAVLASSVYDKGDKKTKAKLNMAVVLYQVFLRFLRSSRAARMQKKNVPFR